MVAIYSKLHFDSTLRLYSENHHNHRRLVKWWLDISLLPLGKSSPSFNVPNKDVFFRRIFRLLSSSSSRLPLMASGRDASEISPLLGKNRNGSTGGGIDSVPVDAGLTTDAADTTVDIERRPSVDEGRDAQFQGSPEIREKLKYILPALAIGVSQSDWTCHQKRQIVTKPV